MPALADKPIPRFRHLNTLASPQHRLPCTGAARAPVGLAPALLLKLHLQQADDRLQG